MVNNNKNKPRAEQEINNRSWPKIPRLKLKKRPCADYGPRLAFKNINKPRPEQELRSAQDRAANTDIFCKIFDELQSCTFDRFINDSMQGGGIE